MHHRFFTVFVVLPTLAWGQESPEATGVVGATPESVVVAAGCDLKAGDIRRYRVVRESRSKYPPSLGTGNSYEFTLSVTAAVEVLRVSPEAVEFQLSLSDPQYQGQNHNQALAERGILGTSAPAKVRLDRTTRLWSLVDPDPWMYSVRDTYANAADPDMDPNLLMAHLKIFERAELATGIFQLTLGPVFTHGCQSYPLGVNPDLMAGVDLPDGVATTGSLSVTQQGRGIRVVTNVESRITAPTGTDPATVNNVHTVVRAAVSIDGEGYASAWDNVTESKVQGIEMWERRSATLLATAGP